MYTHEYIAERKFVSYSIRNAAIQIIDYVSIGTNICTSLISISNPDIIGHDCLIFACYRDPIYDVSHDPLGQKTQLADPALIAFLDTGMAALAVVLMAKLVYFVLVPILGEYMTK